MEDQDIEVRIGQGENNDMICIGSLMQVGCVAEAQVKTLRIIWVLFRIISIKAGVSWKKKKFREDQRIAIG